MTYGKRSTLLAIGLAFLILCAASFPVSVVILHRTGWEGHPISRLTSHHWWLSYDTVSPDGRQYVWYASALLLLALFVFVACIILRSIYRRTAAADVFFFLIFLVTIGFELLRPWIALLSMRGGSVLLAAVSARFVYFGRFFGWTALLISSLYAIDIQYRNLGMLLLASLLLSLTLASSMPLDSAAMLADYLFRLGDEPAILFIVLVCQLAAVANYFAAAYRRQNRRFTGAALAVLLTVLGRLTVSFLGSPGQTIAGFVLCVAGILLFIRQMNQIYLWV